MSTLLQAEPRLSVRLYKTISRETSDGATKVSTRYRGKDPYIDLTPLLGDSSSVRTTKSVREPAGGFAIVFTDQPHRGTGAPVSLESVYGLVEPMDIVEIRMWSGAGTRPVAAEYPIIMRGFVSDVQRGQGVTQEGRPMRTVTVSGQDYGKIWQTYQVLALAAYMDSVPLLTTFSFAEQFGLDVVNAKPAATFVRDVVQKVINKHMKDFLPSTLPKEIPKEIKTGDSIAVKHGNVGLNFHTANGPVYALLRDHGDVGHWNELYTEDREDGVHCVYRPVPYLRLAPQKDPKQRKIHEDAPDPIYCTIIDSRIKSITAARSDANVINFYWVVSSKYDMGDDMTRRISGIQSKDETVSTRDYPNSAAKYYGVRAMNAETHQSDDAIRYDGPGLPAGPLADRAGRMEEWIARRRRQLKESNQDNSVFERGVAVVKGCPMRPSGDEAMKAGDYARFVFGSLAWDAYVYQIEHTFIPYQEYTTTLTFERGEGFAFRTEIQGSPWLAEQAVRLGGGAP